MLTRKTAHLPCAQFYRQLALLYHAGVSLDRSLEICARQTSHKVLQSKSRRLAEDLRHGVRLSDAVARIGAPFTAMHAGVILAGENTGRYDEAFEQIACWEERADSLEQKIRSLATYPVTVLTIALVGCVLLVRFLAPLILSITESGIGDAQAPLATRIVLNIGEVLGSPWFIVATCVAVPLLVWLFRYLVATTLLARWWERWSLSVPLLGKLLKKAWLVRLARCLDSLLRAGIPLVRSMDLAAEASGNRFLGENVLRYAAHGIRKGETLSQALPARFLSGAFVGMLSVGEMTGAVPDMMRRVADLHEVELGSEIEGVLRGLEPVLITVVGLFVLLCLLAALQPLYSMIMRL